VAIRENQVAIRENQDAINNDIRDSVYNIKTMMKALCIKSGIGPSTLNLRIPAVPSFSADPGPPSATPSVVSATSTSSGINIPRLSLGSPLVASPVVGPSGAKAGKAETPGESSVICTLDSPDF
jgi:hypothetical protein